LHRFVAPLASSNLDVPANVHPRCNPARPARRGLNVCGRTPLVLGLFALGDSQCVQEIDAMQRIAPSFPGVQFAAVAVNATRRATERLARSHHWSIPIAYDESGAVGTVYGMEVCPIIELARPGGTVAQRLIGDYWTHPAKLAAAVRRIAPR
jgi:hypothetical protein